MGQVSDSVTEPANVVQSVTVPSDRPLVQVAPATVTSLPPAPMVTAPVTERPATVQGTSVPKPKTKEVDNVVQSTPPVTKQAPTKQAVTPPPVKVNKPALEEPVTEEPVTEAPEVSIPDQSGKHPGDRIAGPADSFEEADRACTATWDQSNYIEHEYWADCIDAALTTWCLVEALPPTDPNYRPEIDDALAECVPPQ